MAILNGFAVKGTAISHLWGELCGESNLLSQIKTTFISAKVLFLDVV